jgi:hypothetical protein
MEKTTPAKTRNMRMACVAGKSFRPGSILAFWSEDDLQRHLREKASSTAVITWPRAFIWSRRIIALGLAGWSILAEVPPA